MVTTNGGLRVEIEVAFDVESAIATAATGPRLLANNLDFLQLNGTYTVTGHIA